MNLILRGNHVKFNEPTTSSLIPDAQVIQHVLKANVIPKAKKSIRLPILFFSHQVKYSRFFYSLH